MRRLFPALAASVLATAFLPTVARAHYIWATVTKGQARFALLEDVNTAPTTAFAKYVASLSPRSGGKTLTLGETKEGARFAALPAGQTLVVAESTVGAKERGGKAYLLIYHAKGAGSLAAAGTLGKMSPEIVAKRVGTSLVVTVRNNNGSVSETEVFIQWPGVPEGASVRTDARGEVKLPWPATTGTGFVGVRAMVSETKSGERDGIKYDSVHHWTTLTFPIVGNLENKNGTTAKS